MNKNYSILVALAIVALIIIGTLINKNKAPLPLTGEESVSSGTQENTDTAPQGGTTSNVKPVSPPAAPKGESGRIIFGITDEAVNLDVIKSVFITVTKLQVHKDKAWTTVLSVPKKYDLLELRKTSSIGLVADLNLPAGSYTQIRLSISEISIVKNDGTASSAKLPSGELTIVSIAPVDKGAISSLIFDFDLEKSLVITGSGSYIFLPVIKISSNKNVFSVEYLPKDKVRISGGINPTAYSFGMNENGEVKENFYFDSLTKFEFIGDAIKVTPQNTNESGVAITPQKAIEIALGSGAVTSVRSIRLVPFDNQIKMWRVAGLKNGIITTVNVNAETGAIILR